MKSITTILVLGLAAIITGCSTTGNDNGNANANTNMARNENRSSNANTNANTARKGTREEYEKNKESYSQQARQLGRKIGTGVDDGWLWTKTRFDLAATGDLSDSTINVDVDNAVVTLTGTVPTAAQKAKAESVAKSVAGIRAVKNQLKVGAANNNSGNANTKANTGNKTK